MALVDKQMLTARLSTRYGVRVSVGLHRRIEDVRDPGTGKIVDQIVHDEGEKFTRADGQPVPQADIDAEIPAAEADETRVIARPQRDPLAEIDALKARIEAVERTPAI